MRCLKCEILYNRKIADSFYKMRIQSAYLAAYSRPGQFLEVRCVEAADPVFLRRPFSVHRILKDGVEVLYKVVGSATEALSQRKKGEMLDVIGPLGNGFDGFSKQQTGNRKQEKNFKPTTNRQSPTTILISGGIGVAPLVALAERLAKWKNIIVMIGARTKTHILCKKEFKALGCKVLVATDDGSKGHKGFITDLLRFLPTTKNQGPRTMYACGPHAMLKTVAHIAAQRHMHCQVSLEERMACGVGVCLGCPVKVRNIFTNHQGPRTNHEYKLVCKDGPVFNAEEIVW